VGAEDVGGSFESPVRGKTQRGGEGSGMTEGPLWGGSFPSGFSDTPGGIMSCVRGGAPIVRQMTALLREDFHMGEVAGRWRGGRFFSTGDGALGLREG